MMKINYCQLTLSISIFLLLLNACQTTHLPTERHPPKLPEVELILIDSVQTLSPTVTAQVVPIGDKFFIYTAGEGTILECHGVSPKGKLTPKSKTKITKKFGGIRGLTHAQIGDQDLLIVGNKAENAVEVHQINPQGELQKISSIADTDSTYLEQNITIELVKIGKRQFVFVGGLDTGLSSFELLENGNLIHAHSIADDATMFLDGIIGMTTLVIEGKTFLFTGGFIDGGISSFQVFADGTFTNVDNIQDDEQLLLTGAFSLSSVQLGANHFVMVSHRHKIHYPFYEKEAGLIYHGDGVNVFRGDGSGKLELGSLFKDNEVLKLKGSTRIETIKISEQQAIVLIATRDDTSIQIAVLDGKGVLSPLLALDTDIAVYNGMTVEKIGGQWMVFVGGYKKQKLYSYLLKMN